MSVNFAGPFSKFQTSNIQTPSQSINLNNKISAASKMETDTFQKKGAKVALVGILGTLAIVGCALAMHKKLEPSILKRQSEILKHQAQDALDVADEVKDIAKRAYGEISGFIKSGKANNYADALDESGKIIRRFTLSENGLPNILEEFSESGDIVRRTEIAFHSGVERIGAPKQIHEYFSGTSKTNTYVFGETGRLKNALFGVKKNESGITESIDKLFFFNKYGECGFYAENFSEDLEKNIQKYRKHFTYELGNLKNANLELSIDNKRNAISKRGFKFDEGNLEEITLNKKREGLVKYKINDEGMLQKE